MLCLVSSLLLLLLLLKAVLDKSLCYKSFQSMFSNNYKLLQQLQEFVKENSVASIQLLLLLDHDLKGSRYLQHERTQRRTNEAAQQ